MADPSDRALRTARIKAALRLPDVGSMLAALDPFAPRKRLKALFSALLDREEGVRWRAVVALGATIAAVAAADQKDGRELWRSLMWRVNEESGAIGWGIPEVMGETLARSPVLADEAARLLLAGVRELPGEASAALDHPGLRRGAWWGIARLAEVRPDLVRPVMDAASAALSDADPGVRGLACLVLARAGGPAAPARIARVTSLADDSATFTLYADDRLTTCRVGDLARRALARLSKEGGEGKDACGGPCGLVPW